MALIIHLQGKPYDIHSNMALCLPVGRSLGVQDELNAEFVTGRTSLCRALKMSRILHVNVYPLTAAVNELEISRNSR
jgi:hypothetical protein